MNLTTSEEGNASTVVNNVNNLAEAVGRNLIVVVLGVTINYINATMVHTFYRHHIFRSNPRYILFIHLVVNDLIQLTTSISLFISTYIFYHLHVWFCVLLVLPAIFTTENTPLNLAFMAVECYISVCVPLRYNQLCTVRRAYVVIGVIWAVSSLSILPDVFLLLATERPEFFHVRMMCRWETVFSSTFSQTKRNVSYILLLVVIWFTLLYTYFRILFAAKAANADAKKARNTIMLHGFQLLLCMTVYVQPMLTKLFLSLFPTSISAVAFAIYIICQIFPRVANPIVYGLRDRTFRTYLKRYLCKCNGHTKITLLSKP